MASRDYCLNVGEELALWSTKLHKLSVEIGHIPSINKYKLLPQIEQLHIIITELDDRLSEMATSCSMVEEVNSRLAKGKESFGLELSQNSSESFDYDFGG